MSAGIGVGRERSFTVRTDDLKMNVRPISRTARSRRLTSPHWNASTSEIAGFHGLQSSSRRHVCNPALISTTVWLSSFFLQTNFPSRDEWWVVPRGSSLRSSDQIHGASPTVVGSLSGAFRPPFTLERSTAVSVRGRRWKKKKKVNQKKNKAAQGLLGKETSRVATRRLCRNQTS